MDPCSERQRAEFSSSLSPYGCCHIYVSGNQVQIQLAHLARMSKFIHPYAYVFLLRPRDSRIPKQVRKNTNDYAARAVFSWYHVRHYDVLFNTWNLRACRDARFLCICPVVCCRAHLSVQADVQREVQGL